MGLMQLPKMVWTKFGYSWAGVTYAIRNEPSVRQWGVLMIFSDLMALWLAPNWYMVGVVFALGLLLVASELINTAIEILVDHVHPQQGEVAKHAKDVASAVTLLFFLALVAVWIGILLDKLG